MNKRKMIKKATASMCMLILFESAMTPNANSQNHFSGPRNIGAWMNLALAISHQFGVGYDVPVSGVQ